MILNFPEDYGMKAHKESRALPGTRWVSPKELRAHRQQIHHPIDLTVKTLLHATQEEDVRNSDTRLRSKRPGDSGPALPLAAAHRLGLHSRHRAVHCGDTQ